MEGREGVGERGQGCFLFSQLIDSQMSGGVGFVAGLKHPVTLFPSTNKHPCTQGEIAHTAAHMHAHVPVALPSVLSLSLSHTHAVSKQIVLGSGNWGWTFFHFSKKNCKV